MDYILVLLCAFRSLTAVVPIHFHCIDNYGKATFFKLSSFTSYRFGTKQGRAIFKCTIPSNPEQSMTLAVPASLKTVRSSRMPLFYLLLSVFDCMCHLLCSFTLFVYSFSLFCLSSAHFLSFSSKLHLSGNQTLPSWSLCLSFPWLVFCKTNLCTCFRLTLLSFSLSL